MPKLLWWTRARQALHLVWQSSPRWFVIGTGSAIAQGLLPYGSLYLVKLLIDRLSAGSSAEAILFLLLGIGALNLLTVGATQLASLATEIQQQQVTERVQDQLHAQSIALDLAYYEDAHYHDTLHRAQTEAPYRPTQIVQQLIALLQNGVSLGAIAVLLLALHWSTGLVLIAIAPMGLFRLRQSRHLLQRWQSWLTQERQARYVSSILTQEPFAKEVRSFQMGSRLQQHFRSLRDRVMQEKMALAFARSRTEFSGQLVGAIAITSILVVLGWETLAGRLSLGSFVLYYQLLNRGQSSLRTVLKSALTLYENSQFLAGFTALLQLKPQIREPEHPQPLAHPFQHSIQFENVSFNYREHRVLDQLNFIISAGQTVAFVGKNGAGKTTLIKLLCRLYDPAQGRILVDGQDLRNVSLTAWRSQITAVFQDFCRYHFSVLENLRLAVPDATLAEMRQAMQTVGLSPLLERLSHQEETILGHQFQDGTELSLGEWQKLAIARCFLRPRPLLIFDEPTSAIDPQAEADLLMALKTLVRDRTTVIISHRLSTVQWCDCIFVLDAGRIVEQGRHEELLARAGLYAQLYTAQSQFYQTLDTD